VTIKAELKKSMPAFGTRATTLEVDGAMTYQSVNISDGKTLKSFEEQTHWSKTTTRGVCDPDLHAAHLQSEGADRNLVWLSPP